MFIYSEMLNIIFHQYHHIHVHFVHSVLSPIPPAIHPEFSMQKTTTIIIIDTFCIALFFIRNELTALHIHTASDDDDVCILV